MIERNALNAGNLETSSKDSRLVHDISSCRFVSSSIASKSLGMIESKCGGNAGPATDAKAPKVFALSGVIGGAANFGSATAKMFGCAFSATRKPFSAFAFSSSEAESLSISRNKSGTIFAAASLPPVHRYMALKATPPAS